MWKKGVTRKKNSASIQYRCYDHFCTWLGRMKYFRLKIDLSVRILNYCFAVFLNQLLKVKIPVPFWNFPLFLWFTVIFFMGCFFGVQFLQCFHMDFFLTCVVGCFQTEVLCLSVALQYLHLLLLCLSLTFIFFILFNWTLY